MHSDPTARSSCSATRVFFISTRTTLSSDSLWRSHSCSFPPTSQFPRYDALYARPDRGVVRLRVYCILVFTPGKSGENRIKFYRFWKGLMVVYAITSRGGGFLPLGLRE